MVRRYAIAQDMKEIDEEYYPDGIIYWVTRCHNTDNYAPSVQDATMFATKNAAQCMIDALNLDDEHIVVGVVVVEVDE